MAGATFQVSLTASQLQAALQSAKQQGVELSQASGVLPETSGVQLSYSVQYGGDGGALITFMVMKKPWIAGVGMIQGRVRQMLGV